MADNVSAGGGADGGGSTGGSSSGGGGIVESDMRKMTSDWLAYWCRYWYYNA